MAQASPDPLPPGTLLGGRYRVERAIATTTTGAVYAAADTRDQHMVALKAIWPSYLDAVGDSILQRFVREAHVSAALPSSHIVPVLNGAVDPDTRIPYIVMPLLHGHDLGHWLEQVAPLPPVIAVRIAMQAAHGLRLAHDYGIVHRDIKPSNIFLDEQPEGRVVVRVSDFGVAKIKPVDEHHITRTGNLLGSPVYMSPEQLMRPQDVDPRADIWSLGMTLYHMLAGHAPLAAVKSFTDLVLMLSQEDIAPIQKAAPWIDPALARVVHGALIRSVSDRCPSIDAFFEALVPFADGCDDVFVLPPTGGTFQGNTANVNAQFLAGCDQGGSPNAPDQLLRLDLPAKKRVVLDMNGSSFYTLLDVRKGPSCPGDEVDLGCTIGTQPQRSFLDLTLDAGTYYLQIDGFNGASGAWQLDVFVVDP